MPLTVLSVAYPLAKVSPGTAGGAEQVLHTMDKALVHHGHRSIVLAAAGSRCHGLLIPVRVSDAELDFRAKRQARESFRHGIHRALSEFNVDVVHMHGLDFHEYLPDGDIPVVVTSAAHNVTSQRLEELDVQAFVAKPFDLDELLNIIEQLSRSSVLSHLA